MAMENDKIQFRGATEKQATQIVDQMRLGGINISELARQGLQEKLRETLSDEEKIELHQRYEEGEIPQDVAEILIGDAIEEIDRERRALEEASELETDSVFQE
jgi:post-segregation antitoxin (ccd killing protein)